MKILYKNIDQSLVFNPETEFRTNAGWEENFLEQQDNILKSIINPIENYETTRYIHEPYNVTISSVQTLQCDIWFYFNFLNSGNTYSNGLDYNLIGISPKENVKLLKHTVNSFFRLEFYTTPYRETQKLVFAKNLSIPLGQKVFDMNLRDDIFIPVFNGNNYRNTENMYLFWFPDNTVYTGTTFYMTARFFNAEDGSILRFLNRDLTVNNSGLVDGTRVGTTSNPVMFYEMNPNVNTNPEENVYYRVLFKRPEHTYTIIRGLGGNCDFGGGSAIKL
jgi:hypothetical protein